MAFVPVKQGMKNMMEKLARPPGSTFFPRWIEPHLLGQMEPGVSYGLNTLQSPKSFGNFCPTKIMKLEWSAGKFPNLETGN